MLFLWLSRHCFDLREKILTQISEVFHQVALIFLRQFPDLGSLCSDSCELGLVLDVITIIVFVDFGTIW